MAPKKLKMTETQNKAQPMVLVDRYDSYEHFAPLMTSNGSVDQEKFELQFYYNFVNFVIWQKVSLSPLNHTQIIKLKTRQ